MDGPGTKVGQKHPSISITAKGWWKKKMESRYGALPSSLQVVTSINEASLLATAHSGETAALDTLCRAHLERER
jgi:hypothetical protein